MTADNSCYTFAVKTYDPVYINTFVTQRMRLFNLIKIVGTHEALCNRCVVS